MARMKAQLVLDPETGKLVQQNVPMSVAEESQRDTEETEWAAGAADRADEALIQAEAEAILEDENQSRREQAITALRGRGEIT